MQISVMIVLLVLAIIIGISFFYFTSKSTTSTSSTSTASNTQTTINAGTSVAASMTSIASSTISSSATTINQQNQSQAIGAEAQALSNCRKVPNLIFSYNLTNLSEISGIVPPGTVAAGEIKPHSFLRLSQSAINSNISIPVWAPTNLTLFSGTYYNFQAGQNEYVLYFQATCNIRVYIGHITKLVPALSKFFPTTPHPDTRTNDITNAIEIKAGQLIGYTTGDYPNHFWDFGVYNMSKPNQYVNQSRYLPLWRALYGICPYDLFDSTIKPAYTSKFISQFGAKLPHNNCGGVDQDKAGTIAGGWFLDGAIDPYNGRIPYLNIADSFHEGRVYIGGLVQEANVTNQQVVTINSTNPTYTDPKNVTTEHCYAIGTGIAYFKLLSPMHMAVYYGINVSSCPNSFPTNGYKIYNR